MSSGTGLKTGLLAALALALSACATAPEEVAEVEEARAKVESLASQEQADSASRELAEARNALARADAGLEEGAPIEQVRHDAYIAGRQAEIGLQIVAEAEAEERIRQGEVERQRVQLQAREAEAERARQLAEERAREAEASRSMAEAAIEDAERMAQEMQEMEARQTERGMVLTLSDVLFETDSDQLQEGAEITLDRLEQFLNDNPERKLLIEGHTDSRGSEEYNRDLAQRRATSVVEALVQRGVPSDRLRPVGLGEAYPVASNDNAGGMQQNRRVEIVISNPDGSFPESAERRAVAAIQQ